MQIPFWSERQSESLFGFEEEELRPYFALPNVLSGLFGLCKRSTRHVTRLKPWTTSLAPWFLASCPDEPAL